MATKTILQLLQATSLTGAEYIEATQSGTSVRLTTGQIAQLAPNVTPTGPTGVISATIAGVFNDFNVGGQFAASTGFIELTLSGAANITGLAAGFDGQIVVITNLSATPLTLNAVNGGSQAANQFRMTADQILTQFDPRTFKYSASIGKWVML